MGWHNKITDEERAFIRKNFTSMSLKEIATSLGRGYYTIYKQAKLMHLRRVHVWTDDEDTILIRLWGTFDAKYIARRIGVDENCVYNRIKRLRSKGIIK